MMKRSTYKYLVPAVVILMVWLSCKKVYNPTIVASNLNYLVVEGMINTGGTDSTFIKLSRTSNIASAITNKPELKASIKVEGDNNITYSLTEKGLGAYYLPPMNLGFTHKYRVRIKTNDGREYLSEYAIAKPAPPIDSITFTASDDQGVRLYVNSHDPSNNSRYYRWDFIETWEYYSKYQSISVSNGTSIVPRDMVNNDIYHCWNTASSNNLILGSSAKLSQDIITHEPITTMETSSPKVTVKYSMLLKQYALTADEYNYLDNIKKNNENLGSIFDAQPSDSRGNIRCISNSSEVVIGYVGAGAYTTKRIYINRSDIHSFKFPLDNCDLDTVYFSNPKTGRNDVDFYFIQSKPPLIPVEKYMNSGYTGSSADCVDCRTKGGVTRKPAFWP